MDKRDELLKAGRWLRQERERRKLSVRDFATKCDVTTQVVYDWQNGKSGFNDERAEQFAEILKMDLLDVRRNLGLWVPPKPTDEETLDQVDRLDRLFREYRDDPGEKGITLRTVLEGFDEKDAG